MSTSNYKKTDAQLQAEEALRRHTQEKPAAYSSQWSTQRAQAAQKLADSKPFSYDINGDALYRQLKDQYVQQGRQAMLDTVGRTAALTGGYGNSYSQSAGQQAYHSYLQQLTDRLPELQNMALQRYNTQNQQLKDQYDLYTDLEEADYSRYGDALQAYYEEQDRLLEEARYQQQLGYTAYRDQLADALAQQEFAYQQQRDQEADRQWQAEFDEDLRRYELENAPKSGGATVQQQEEVATLSKNGQVFLSRLPYAHAGSSQTAWKKLVAQRLQGAKASGQLTDTDVQILVRQLKLYE